jgi:hypothetical protein
LTRGESPTFGPVTIRLVGYGIARLRDDHQGEIVEPLSFLSLLRWLRNHHPLSQESNPRTRLSIPEARGQAYEEMVIRYLLRTCRRGLVTFRTIFNFHTEPPSWADKPADVVARLEGAYVPVDFLGDTPQNPSIGVAYYSINIDEILRWLQDPPDGSQTTPAVLVAGHLFGPDIMIRFGDILGIGRCKSYLDDNGGSLDATQVLTSLNPDHWFQQEVCWPILFLFFAHTLW